MKQFFYSISSGMLKIQLIQGLNPISSAPSNQNKTNKLKYVHTESN